MLTRKQRELLLFINQRLTATGVSPSFDEMKDALNLKSKSGIHRLVRIGSLALPLHGVEVIHVGLIGLFIVAEQTHRISRLET